MRIETFFFLVVKLNNLIVANFWPSDLLSVPTNELSCVIIRVVPALSCVITF